MFLFEEKIDLGSLVVAMAFKRRIIAVFIFLIQDFILGISVNKTDYFQQCQQ